MIRLISIYIIILLIIIACSSPLKSNVEVMLNKAFGTDFDVMDIIIVQKLAGNQYETKSILNTSDFVTIIAELESTDSIPLDEPSYKFVLSTSEKMNEFNKKQTEAILIYSPKDDIICYEKKCKETNETFKDFLKSSGLE
jgi:hypothetical protein